ncbi:hypothetical protein N7470_003057 [Penicillium chermesinum]|nr:hypothetical protein N7470_003057 [Penicillium chermesinum]
MSQKLQVAVAGIGRMGMRHARHFANFTPRAELIAVCSPVQAELDAAKAEWPDVRTYKDYEDMLNSEKTLQAVVVASATTVHAEQAIKAIERGLHVLCEKPISTSPEISQTVVDAYAASIKKFPAQKVICGFSRRFDASYRDAHRRMASGDFGTPSVFRSQTCDKLDPSGFFVAYAEFSGGIFVDCSIHDIDLALWFFGEDIKIKSVTAIGITAVQPDLRKHNDRDNALGIIEFYGGKIAQLYCSRMMAAGQEDCTEIFGTKGKIAVNTQPQLNLVNLRSSPEANEFTASALDNTPPPLRLDTAVKAVTIGAALQESLITEKKIEFTEDGKRVTK